MHTNYRQPAVLFGAMAVVTLGVSAFAVSRAVSPDPQSGLMFLLPALLAVGWVVVKGPLEERGWFFTLAGAISLALLGCLGSLFLA